MRPRRRQAQRSRQCRLHRAAPHLFRDAGKFLVRRLFQGTRDRTGLESGDQGLRARPRAALGHRPRHRRGGRGALGEDRRAAGRQDPPHRLGRQLVADGRHRPERPVHRDLLRSWAGDLGRAAGQRGGGRRPVHRDLELGVHAVRDASRRHLDAAAETVGRHRHGPGADRRAAAGQARQLRHRSDAQPDRSVGQSDRRRAGRAGAPSSRAGTTTTTSTCSGGSSRRARS